MKKLFALFLTLAMLAPSTVMAAQSTKMMSITA